MCVKQSKNGRVASLTFNAGESGVMVNPLIENGRLLTKTGQSRALGEKAWQPLNGTWTFFLQHASGQAEIRALQIVQNQIHPADSVYVQPGTNGFSVPYILKQGKRVPLKNPPPRSYRVKRRDTVYDWRTGGVVSNGLDG